MKIINNLIRLAIVFALVFFGASFAMSGSVSDYSYPIRYKSAVSKYCQEYGVQESLVFAVIKNESDFNPYAKSSAQAKGLMQICDDTFEHVQKHIPLETGDVFDKETNIQAGIWYLSFLIARFQDVRYAVLAYNAGPENVAQWLDLGYLPSDLDYTSWEIPFAETKAYLDKVMKTDNIYKQKLQKFEEQR